MRYDSVRNYTRAETAAIRSEARRIAAAKVKRPYVCSACGYVHGAQVAHIKPISAFTTAQRDQVNRLSNLAMLCARCHFELDHTRLPVTGRTLAGTRLKRYIR